MKKSIIAAALTLFGGTAICPAVPTFAAIQDNGTTWWSVDELLNFYQEVEAEKEAECGENQDCIMEFNWTMLDKGPKYSALNNLLEGQIWVTSVNPAAENVKVLFFDDEMMLRHMGIQEKISLDHLYLGWFEDWRGQIYNYDHDKFASGAVTGGVHTMYDSTEHDIGEITPWEEVELSVEGSELINNTSGKIGYAAYANNFNAQGGFDFSSCLNAPDYEPGVDCEMKISGDQWVSYFPPREEMNDDKIGDTTQDVETPVGNENAELNPTTPSQGEEPNNREPEPTAPPQGEESGNQEPDPATSLQGDEPGSQESEPTAPLQGDEPSSQESELGVSTTETDEQNLVVQADTDDDAKQSESKNYTNNSGSNNAKQYEYVVENHIKAPETGKASASSADSSEAESSNFLSKWWLIGGIVVGFFLLSVWFLLKVFRFQRETE